MAYKIYRGLILVDTVEDTSVTVSGLVPATSYNFSVSETDGTNESSKSSRVYFTTNGRLTIPTTKEVVSITYSMDTLGIEIDGLDTGSSFGGTTPVPVSIRDSFIEGTYRILEVAPSYHMGGRIAELVDENTYLLINGNKSIEIKVK